MTQLVDNRIQQSEQSILRTEEEIGKLLVSILKEIRDVIMKLGKLLDKHIKEKNKGKLLQFLEDQQSRLQKAKSQLKAVLEDEGIGTEIKDKIPKGLVERIDRLEKEIEVYEKQIAQGNDINKIPIGNIKNSSAEVLVIVNQIVSQVKGKQNPLNPATRQIANTGEHNPSNEVVEENQVSAEVVKENPQNPATNQEPELVLEIRDSGKT